MTIEKESHELKVVREYLAAHWHSFVLFNRSGNMTIDDAEKVADEIYREIGGEE